MTDQPCDHKFIFLRSAKWTESSGGYSTGYFRVDTFYCEKCLVQKATKTHDWRRDTPDWYRGGDGQP